MKLISFLGDTVYRTTTYRWQDREISTAYAAAACCEFFHPDELIVFCTEEAYSANWEGLCSAVREINGPEPVYRNIAIGKNEAELWQIFGDLTETIPSGSEIAIDLTNGQRSLAAVVILASVFMKTGLNVNISHLYYGAFNVDKEMPGISPMFDLSPMLELVNWGIAAERFNRDGDSSDLAEQFYQYAHNYTRDHTGEEREAGRILKSLANDLTDISRSYLLLRPKQTRKAEQQLRDHMEKAGDALANMPEQEPLKLLLSRIESTYLPKIENTENEAVQMLLQERSMINWYRHHGHYMQAVSLSREWLLTWLMVQNGVNSTVDLDNAKLREAYKQKFFRKHKKAESDPLDTTEGKGEPQDLEIGDIYVPEDVNEKEFFTLFDTLGDQRNDMAHAGKRGNPNDPKHFVIKINERIDRLMKLPIAGEES